MLRAASGVRGGLKKGEGELFPIPARHLGTLVVPGTGGDQYGDRLLAFAPAGEAEVIGLGKLLHDGVSSEKNCNVDGLQ